MGKAVKLSVGRKTVIGKAVKLFVAEKIHTSSIRKDSLHRITF